MTRVPGKATYNGNQSHIVGQVMGPTTYGSHVVADEAIYDPETNKTEVWFRNATVEDIEKFNS